MTACAQGDVGNALVALEKVAAAKQVADTDLADARELIRTLQSQVDQLRNLVAEGKAQLALVSLSSSLYLYLYLYLYLLPFPPVSWLFSSTSMHVFTWLALTVLLRGRCCSSR